MNRPAGTIAFAAALLCGCSAPPPAPKSPERPTERQVRRPSPYGEDFRSVWGNGHTEVSNYEFRSRTGEKGTATLASVATHFSKHTGTEAPESAGGPDVVPAMKLTVWRRLPEHTELTTAFISLEEVGGLPAGAATAVTWSTQSLEGNSWAQLAIARDGITATFRRPYEGEVRRNIDFRTGTIPADVLPLVARRIAWPRLRLGQKDGGWILSELNGSDPLTGYWATTSITQDRQTVVTPAGSFRVHVFRASVPEQPTRTWYVEADAPYRIVRWEFSSGEVGALVSTSESRRNVPPD